MDENLDKSQQCVLATQEASHILGFIKGSVASRPRELSLPSCSAPPLLPPGLSSPAQESQGSVGACRGGHEDDTGAGASLLQRQAESWGCALWRTGGSREILEHLPAPNKRAKEAQNVKQRLLKNKMSNGFRLKEASFRLYIQKTFFRMAVEKCCNWLLREVSHTWKHSSTGSVRL